MPSRAERTILHVDMDAFYVSVELLTRHDLRGRPVVVGGTGDRGVVAAASYEARRFGIHSAMAMVQARRRCPDLVALPGDHARYAAVSADIMGVLHDVSPLVEPIALDEAFVDATGAVRRLGPGGTIATIVRDRIAEVTGLACSVGIAPNKFLAKLASEAAKPRILDGRIAAGPGVFEVEPGTELSFLHPLPVGSLWGVGPVTLSRLESAGVRTVGDLANIDERVLTHLLGQASGRHLAELARGVDDRPVEAHRAPRSIGHEETFAEDLRSVVQVHREVVRLADSVAGRLRAQGRAARTVSLKVRHGDFTTWARSITPGHPLDTAPEIVAALAPILDAGAGSFAERGVRLVGVSASNLVAPHRQLSFDDVAGGTVHGARPAQDWSGVSEAVDAIRGRFGGGAIRPASAVAPPPGERPWGPDRT
jgi:DNA polymerase IV